MWKGTLHGTPWPSWWLSLGPAMSFFREVNTKSAWDYMWEWLRQGDTLNPKSPGADHLYHLPGSRGGLHSCPGTGQEALAEKAAAPTLPTPMLQQQRLLLSPFLCLTLQGASQHFRFLNALRIVPFLAPAPPPHFSSHFPPWKMRTRVWDAPQAECLCPHPPSVYVEI